MSFSPWMSAYLVQWPGFAPYDSDPSMFHVHRFMRLDPSQLGYFVQQVALAGASFGVAEANLQAVGAALQQLFGLRCAPPVEVVKSHGPQLQAICIAESCQLAPDAVCSMYDGPDGTSGGNGGMAGSGSPTASPTGVSTTGAAATAMNIAAAAIGVAALLL